MTIKDRIKIIRGKLDEAKGKRSEEGVEEINENFNQMVRNILDYIETGKGEF